MKKKILIGSIFAALLMLSMPVISNIQAQPTATIEKTENCSICPIKTSDGRPFCNWLMSESDRHLDAYYDLLPIETWQEFFIGQFHRWMLTLLDLLYQAALCPMFP